MVKPLIYGIVILGLLVAAVPTADLLSRGAEVRNARVRGIVKTIQSPRNGLVQGVITTEHGLAERGDVVLRLDSSPEEIEIDELSSAYEAAFDEAVEACFRERILHRELELAQASARFEAAKAERVAAAGSSRQEIETQELAKARSLQDVEIKRLELLALQSENRRPLWQRTNLRRIEARIREQFRRKELSIVHAADHGYIERMLVQPGEYVSAGQEIAVFVPRDSRFVEANILENRISKFGVGTAVTVTPDLDRGLTIPGRVTSVVPATAASFSPLPRNDDDSNWIKVAQRVPVIIELVPDAQTAPLPIGASVTVRAEGSGETNLEPAIEISDRTTRSGEVWQAAFEAYITRLREEAAASLPHPIQGRCVDGPAP